MLAPPTREKGESQRQQEGDAERLRQRRHGIAAGHGKGAVREIDEAHQPHGDRQADRDDEQQRAVGQAVEDEADQDLAHGMLKDRPPQ